MKNYLTKAGSNACTLLLLLGCMLLSYQTGAQNLQNPNATPEAKSLWLFLNEVYGKKILSGQVNERWLPLIQNKTGKQPAILGLDFDGICPSQGGNNGANVAIDYVKNKGGIVQFQWHWISPNADGDYYSSNFKLGDALNNPNGQSYKNMIRDIDLVAGEIKKMQDAGVPIIWRPLHESEGAWFWWGMSGKDALIKLYRLMYDRFTNFHKLNNIIWIWNSYGSDKGNWYPGDDVCDIIAWDYETSSSWSQFQSLFGNKGKLFGLAEVGTLPDPNNFSARPWSFFICWDYMIQDPSEPNQDPSGRQGQNATSWTQRVYSDSKTINLSDLASYNVYGRVGLVSNAGPDQTITSQSGSSVQVALDGSASKTTNGTISSYVWKEGTTQIATGVKPTVTLSVGIHTITLTVTDSNGKTASDNVVVSVKLPNIALNKPVTVSSTEAGANVAANAVDGNVTTRWSSLYADPQWIQIDLQGNYDISAVTLNWEAASGKDYKIEVSPDATTWTTVLTKTGMAAGARIDNLAGLTATGRYMRLSGTARTSAFGYSLFEFEVNGTVVANGPKANAGVDQNVTDSDNSGAEQITLDGSASADATGTITSYVWKENGTQIATGVKPLISLAVGTHTISLTITNSNNVISTDEVVVVVNPFVPVNIARNKPVTVSSTEAGANVAANAVDGNTTTRWSSLYADPQWIQVDLQATYAINKVVLNWEAAAAKDYRIDRSNDGVAWVTLLIKTAMPPGPRIDNLPGITGNYRYIRVTCTSRTTQWGDSLYEFEVYGTTVSNVAVTGVTLTPTSATLNVGQTQQLSATVAPANATNKSVSFVSSNTAVATVSASGLVTAVANGTATITVTTADGGKTATSVITVSTTNVAVTGVTLTPASVSLTAAGQTQQLTATVSPADATNKNVSYVSSNTNVATVSSSGLVTAVANGTATITVTTQDGGKTATSAATVNIGSCTLLSKYGVPRASALPSFNTTFPKIFVLGSGGPNLSNVSSSVVQWELQYNGLWQFAFNTNNGSPDWYVNLIPKTTQTFNASSPACKITASGIAGLDGDYWVNMDGANFVMVAKSGSYAIYFSTVSTAPSSCNGRMISVEETSDASDVTIYPTEVSMNNILHVVLPAHMVGGNVVVMDVNGKRIKQQIANGRLVDVLIDQSFNRSMYLLNVNKDKQVYIKKFMVK